MSELALLVAADDLTGANDTAVSFALAGYPTELLMDCSELSTLDTASADVFAVSSDSRAQGSAARELTCTLVNSAIQNGIARLYVKIDSTMRGSVAHQVAGALDVWKKRHPDAVAVICSAYPDLGRTIEGGVLRVNGIEVHETASGKDPVCPVTSPLMTTLLPDAVALENPGEAHELACRIRDADSDQVVVDAASARDMWLFLPEVGVS